MLGPFASLDHLYCFALGALWLAIAGAVPQRTIARVHLVRPMIPKPIITLEKASTLKKLGDLRDEWGQEGCAWARRTLLWDLLFLVGYGTGLSLLCTVGAVNFRAMNAGAGAWVWGIAAWAALGAAALDLAENVCLWFMLQPQPPGESLPSFMFVASRLKW